MIKFGPTGIGKAEDVEETFREYNRLGIRAAEIPFTYQVWIRDRKVAEKIKEQAEKFDIQLSIHAPYWINLNSNEKIKIEESKKRILACCEVGDWLAGKEKTRIVFHAGFYGKMEKEKTYQNIRKEVLEILAEVKKNKWRVELCPETMGKVNVFGSAEEILKLADETGCDFCIDFAHLWAREQGKISYEEICRKFLKAEKWHCHFSGIIFGDKGERSHKMTPDEEIAKLLAVLPKDKEITIINESPAPVEDSLKMIYISKKFR